MTRRPLLRRRRAAEPVPGAEPAPATVAPEAAPDAPTSVALPLPPAQTAVHTPVAAPDPAAPAGLEVTPPDVPPLPGFRERGRLRRRLRYLRRVRELGFRDVGGLVFDLHRFGRDGGDLVAGKLAALGAVDTELRALEDALGDRREHTVLREPGIAACPRCAALHGSDANFCPNCGIAFHGPQAVAQVATPAAAGDPAPPAAPASEPLRWAAVGSTPVHAPTPPTAEHPAAGAPQGPPAGPGDRPGPADATP